MSLNNKMTLLVASLNNIKENHLNIKCSYDDDIETILIRKKNLGDVGSDLFEKFCELGCEATKLKLTSFKSVEDEEIKFLVEKISTLLVEIYPWLNNYLPNYPFMFIYIDEYESVGIDACEVRSGFQFMLDLFKGINPKLDDILQKLDEAATEDFDKKIKFGKEWNKFEVEKEDIPEFIPKHHIWWSK
ncbi:unnamed protein product [Brachionus calyciflorus]|uniref:Uncharacterized protein n=1 Tax=Brachionus calyciflorus TaxID=104777 RepID=A0A813QTK5_9BILA|nr:unnamed protein product [Brachionus calyciflorus]